MLYFKSLAINNKQRNGCANFWVGGKVQKFCVVRDLRGTCSFNCFV